MPRARVGNLELHYDRGGAGAPVIYVHGGFADLATRLADFSTPAWTETSWEYDFARQFDFAFYERRGCYRSDSPPNGYGPLTQANDLAGLLDALGITSAHIVGSSAGGPIATVFAASYPERVRSIVLAGTALQVFPASDPIIQTVVHAAELLARAGPETAFDSRPKGVEATYASLWGHVEASARGRLQQYRSRELELADRARRLSRAERVHYHALELQNMIAFVESDVRPYAERVSCPTLVLHGRDDRDVPLSLGEELARTIPGAALHVLEDEGHSVVHRTGAGRRATIEWIIAREAVLRGGS